MLEDSININNIDSIKIQVVSVFKLIQPLKIAFWGPKLPKKGARNT